MWSDLQAVLGNINTVEFYAGMHPEKPMGATDWEQIELALHDARARLGELALALSEGADS